MLILITYCTLTLMVYSSNAVFSKEHLNRMASAIAWPVYAVVYLVSWVRDILVRRIKEGGVCQKSIT